MKSQQMGLIIGLVCDREARARLRHALSEPTRLEFCSRRAEFVEAVLRGPVRVLVTELWDSTGEPMTAVVRRLRTGFPATPILAYCWLSCSTAHEILEMARAGISGIIFRGYDDVGSALRSALARAEDLSVAEAVSRAITPLISPEGRTIVEYCIEHARAAPAVSEVAAAIGVHRKTLVNWMASAGLPAPSAVIAWCRLLLAARLLEEPARSVECVALDLDFGSATELRNMLRRYTGLRPTEVRQRGGFGFLLKLFTQQFRPTSRSVAQAFVAAPTRPIIPLRNSPLPTP